MDFGEAIAAEPDRVQGRRIPHSTHRGLEAPPTECLFYSRVASFSSQVERYKALFDHVHVVLHDDIKADVEQTYCDVLRFLGVDTNFKPDFSVVNPNTRAKSQTMRRLIQSLWFGPWRHAVPGPLRRAGRRGFERLQAMNTETSPRPPLDPTVAAEVAAMFETEVERLAAVIDRPLLEWRA